MNQLLEWNAENPFPFYQNMRHTQPVFKDSSQRWNVFLYEDVKRVLSDNEHFSSQISFEPMSILFMDAPEHQKYRSSFSKAMTPQLMNRLSTGIATQAKNSLREFIEQEKVDIVDSFSMHVPLEAITLLLGIDPDERQRFKEWAKLVFGHRTELGASINMEELFRQQEEMTDNIKACLSRTIDCKKKYPAEDLISALIQVQENSDLLTRDDMEEFCFLLLVGGIDTSVNLITHSLVLLGEYPDLFTRLKENPDELPKFLEEVLRFRSPVQSAYRIAAKNVEIGGHSIRRGEPIVAWIGSANHDERVFENANSFNANRKNNHQHIAFSYGGHYCMGAHLARMEAKIILSEIISSIHQIHNLPNSERISLQSTVTFGYESFPMKLTLADQ